MCYRIIVAVIRFWFHYTGPSLMVSVVRKVFKMGNDCCACISGAPKRLNENVGSGSRTNSHVADSQPKSSSGPLKSPNEAKNAGRATALASDNREHNSNGAGDCKQSYRRNDSVQRTAWLSSSEPTPNFHKPSSQCKPHGSGKASSLGRTLVSHMEEQASPGKNSSCGREPELKPFVQSGIKPDKTNWSSGIQCEHQLHGGDQKSSVYPKLNSDFHSGNNGVHNEQDYGTIKPVTILQKINEVNRRTQSISENTSGKKDLHTILPEAILSLRSTVGRANVQDISVAQRSSCPTGQVPFQPDPRKRTGTIPIPNLERARELSGEAAYSEKSVDTDKSSDRYQEEHGTRLFNQISTSLPVGTRPIDLGRAIESRPLSSEAAYQKEQRIRLLNQASALLPLDPRPRSLERASGSFSFSGEAAYPQRNTENAKNSHSYQAEQQYQARTSLPVDERPEDLVSDKMETDSSRKRKGTSEPPVQSSTPKAQRKESSKRKNRSESEKHQLRQTIINQLCGRLREKYSKLGEIDRNFWLDCRTRSDSGRIEERFSALNELLPAPGQWKMLVFGKPFFGKTTLCRSLAVTWAKQDQGSNNAFVILKCYKLDEKLCSNLEENLVDGLVAHVKEGSTTKKQLKQAWAKYMDKTLLVLDGYDLLDPKNKSLVKQFLVSNDYFHRACVLLTSRPDNDIDLTSSFSIQADICGLNENTLSKLTGLSPTDLQKCRVKELYGVSPFFAQAVAEVIKDKRPESLYQLLDSVINLFVDREMVDKSAIKHIGDFLLARLRERKFTFKKEAISSPIKGKWEAIEKLKFFVRVRQDKNGLKILAVSHLNFMVYFAVRSLRESWTSQTSPRQKEVFLKKQLSFDDSSSEQIVEQRGACNNCYYVGLIPEIVFDLFSEKFQMIQDVDCPALRVAFEPGNLLFRLDKKRLPAYRIEETDDPLLENSFDVLLNMLDFEDLTVYRTFYEAHGSDLPFLKFSVVDEDNDRVVLMCVASVNPLDENKINEICLDFQDSSMPLICPFLNKVSKKFYRLKCLEASMKGPELIHRFILFALERNRNYFTQLSLQSSTTPVKTSSLITAEVVSKCDKSHSLSLSCYANGKTKCKLYDNNDCHDLRKNSDDLLNTIKEYVVNENELTVTVRVKTKFSELR